MTRFPEMTVAIAARNAAATVRRAARSAAGAGAILLIDDYSEDATASEAKAGAGASLRIVRPQEKLGLGNARQTGLENVDTKYLMWLDADDELLPGRIERMLARLEAGADIVFDAAELRDGETGALVRNLGVPRFLSRPPGLLRLFERNYLPGPAWPALRTELARGVGYDRALPTAEDLDFNLRALKAGARVALLEEVGYCQYAYRRSLSRDLRLQRSSAGRALEKHGYGETAAFLAGEGVDARLIGWTLHSMALFREDFSAAAGFLDAAFPPGCDFAEIREPDGPYAVPSGWLRAFARGTLDLLAGGCDAEGWLEQAVALRPGADALNNSGVARARQGDAAGARARFEAAMRAFPGYLDARLNLQSEAPPQRVTTHPLRQIASRSEY